jgi:hypothetical protein
MAKHVLSIMDHTGHSTVQFDPDNDAEVRTAMKKFDELTKGEKKMIAATRTADGKQQLVRAFDPNAEETVFHEQLKGG